MELETFGLPDAAGNVVCRCPFGSHADVHPSASFNVNTGLLYCFSCKQGANSYHLRTRYGIELPVINGGKKIIRRTDDKWKELWRYSYPFTSEDEAVENSKEYAHSRGIMEDTARLYDIRLSSTGVLFPFKSFNGKVIGFQERRIVGSPKYVIMGQRTPLWPYCHMLKVHKNTNVYLVEGIFSAIRMRQCGYIAFAIVGSRYRNAKEVLNVLEEFVPFNDIVVSFDNDDAGKIATYEYMKLGVKGILPGFSPDDADCEAIEFMSNKYISLRKANFLGIDVHYELFG